jgi:hypothetical protein
LKKPPVLPALTRGWLLGARAFQLCELRLEVRMMLPNDHKSSKPVWSMRKGRFESFGVSQPFFSGNG